MVDKLPKIGDHVEVTIVNDMYPRRHVYEKHWNIKPTIVLAGKIVGPLRGQRHKNILHMSYVFGSTSCRQINTAKIVSWKHVKVS
jgi:hypothetical protein